MCMLHLSLFTVCVKAEIYLEHNTQTKQIWDMFITYKVTKEIPVEADNIN